MLPKRIAQKITHVPGPLESPCWIWTGRRHRRGYGQVRLPAPSRRVRLAHLVVYELLKGAVPVGLEADHVCRNTSCVHPEHLEFVTHQENCARSDGSWIPGERNRNKVHCPKGHPYSGSNLYVLPAGGRCCRTCGREKMRARYAAKRAA
jgi:hypothetical protein